MNIQSYRFGHIQIDGKDYRNDVKLIGKRVVSEWWRSTMATRSTDISKTARVIIMQRLAGDDLAGEMIDSGEYEHLMLPMRFESKRKCFTCIGFEDPRREEGELLDSKRFPEKPLKILEKELGPRATQAQLQQNPTPAEGTIFKNKHANIQL